MTRGSEATAVNLRATLRPAMARKQMAWKDWLKAITSRPTGDGFHSFAGFPVDEVSKRLRVSRQRVHALIEADRLDVIEILTTKGSVALTLVTEASLAKFEPRATGGAGHLSYIAE